MYFFCAVCDATMYDDEVYYAVGTMLCEECGQKYEEEFMRVKHEFNERYVQAARNAVSNERDRVMIDAMLADDDFVVIFDNREDD